MKEKIIVMEMHGKGEIVEYVTFRTFKSARAAHLYAVDTAANDGDAVQGDESWVRCEFVEEWVQYPMGRIDTEALFEWQIPLLDDRSLQKVMREIDSEDLAKALRGAGQETRDKFFRNMSKRAAAMLQEEMEHIIPMGKSGQLKARRKILNSIELLAADGEIIIPGSSWLDEFVVV